jgi:hypothetical protein
VALSDQPPTDTQRPAGDLASAEADEDAAVEQAADVAVEQDPGSPPDGSFAGPGESDDAWLPL